MSKCKWHNGSKLCGKVSTETKVSFKISRQCISKVELLIAKDFGDA